jgi:hypothetical protein
MGRLTAADDSFAGAPGRVFGAVGNAKGQAATVYRWYPVWLHLKLGLDLGSPGFRSGIARREDAAWLAK